MRPGMRKSPPQSMPASGGSPSPISAMVPSATATQPGTIRSASTTFAWARTKARGSVTKALRSCGGRVARDIDDAVGDAVADVLVVENAEDGDALRLFGV